MTDLMKQRIIYIFGFIFFSNFAFSQESKVEFTPDTTRFVIGKQVDLLLSATAPKDSTIVWPEIPDTLGQLEVVSRSVIDTSFKSDFQILTQNFKITQFDSGSYVLNPVRFKIGNEILYTRPRMFEVVSVEVDTTKQKMYGIKGNIRVGYSFWEIIPWILIFLLLILSAFGIFYYLKRRQPKQKKAFIPEIPPYEQAMKSLKDLDSSGLLEKGEIKEYYVKLSDILRRYIEDEHSIPALESTTDELMNSAYSIEISEETRNKMRELLRESDFVKFAKYKPESGKHPYYRKTTEDIIKAVKPEVKQEGNE